MRISIIIFLFLLHAGHSLNAQIITTVAGNGTAGNSGDGGFADSAKIYIPGKIVFDSAGNFYFAERLYNSVRKVSACGIITTIAGIGTAGFSGDGGPATAAQLNQPGFIGLYHNNLFIPELYNNRIRKVDLTTGIITTVAGNGYGAGIGTATGGFSGDGGLANSAELYNPTAVCVDYSGNLYILDASNHRVRKVDTFGIITTVVGNGIWGDTGDGSLADSAEINADAGLGVDGFGNIYLPFDARVRKVNAVTGIITTIVGNGNYLYNGEGLIDTVAQVDPFDVCFDALGNMYIADIYNYRVRKVDTAGYVYTVAGNGTAAYGGDGGPATAAEIYDPEGVAIDANGNLLLGDAQNNRIRKVTFNPVILPTITIAATPGDTVCSGASVTFTAALASTSTSVTYQWYVDGIFITGATSSTYTYTPVNGDSVSCALSVTGLCNTPVSNTIVMAVIPITTPTIIVTAPAAAAVGSTVTVNATVAGAGSGYSINWYNNSTLFSTTALPTTTYTKATGTDHITATVVPGEGCYDSTTSAAVTVDASTTGVRNTSSPSERPGEVIFPNPAHNTITITAQHLTNITITNLLGQTMLSKDYNTDQVTIKIETLPAGIYTLKTTTTEGEKTITKIVKQ